MNELLNRYPSLCECKDDIEKAAKAIIECYEKGGKLLLCGNGGSCADCEHIVGEVDLAYNMIVRPDYPSYGNWVKRGATTLWEAFHPENGPVLSLNHHFWGDISAWFYTYLSGMRINPTGKDVTNVNIMPFFPEKLNSVSAYHDLRDGRISVAWERTSDQSITLKIEAAEKLHGKIVLTEGFTFLDGSKEKTLASGNFHLSAN